MKMGRIRGWFISLCELIAGGGIILLFILLCYSIWAGPSDIFVRINVTEEFIKLFSILTPIAVLLLAVYAYRLNEGHERPRIIPYLRKDEKNLVLSYENIGRTVAINGSVKVTGKCLISKKEFKRLRPGVTYELKVTDDLENMEESEILVTLEYSDLNDKQWRGKEYLSLEEFEPKS